MASLLKTLIRFDPPMAVAAAVPGVDELFERFEREASEPVREQLASELFGLLCAASRGDVQPFEAR